MRSSPYESSPKSRTSPGRMALGHPPGIVVSKSNRTNPIGSSLRRSGYKARIVWSNEGIAESESGVSDPAILRAFITPLSCGFAWPGHSGIKQPDVKSVPQDHLRSFAEECLRCCELGQVRPVPV